MCDLRLFGHQHHALLPPHRFRKRLIAGWIARSAKEGIEDHQRAAVGGQSLQQTGVQRPVPRLISHLMEMVERLVIHLNQHHLVRDRVRPEAEQVIVAGVHPGIAQRRATQEKTAKRSERGAEHGPEESAVTKSLQIRNAIGFLRLSIRKNAGNNNAF
jgi:hypothetical protein